jgi:hypothetical protein
MRSVLAVALAATAGVLLGLTYSAEQWVITKRSTSNICTVQSATSRPLLGTVIGTYDSKGSAEKALKKFKESKTCE